MRAGAQGYSLGPCSGHPSPERRRRKNRPQSRQTHKASTSAPRGVARDRRLRAGLRHMTARHLLTVLGDLARRHGNDEARAAADALIQQLLGAVLSGGS